MKRWLLFSLSALTGASLATLVSQPDVLPSAAAASSGTFQQLSLFSYVFDRVRAYYVEPPNEAKLIEGAISGMLTSLDPHSGYMSPKELREMQTETRGAFGGLGIEVTMEEGLVKVIAPIDDTPAARAGILANDIITQVSGEPVQGLTLNQAVDKMRGPVNSSVKLTIQRKEKKEPIEVKLTRETIRIRPVRARTEGGATSATCGSPSSTSKPTRLCAPRSKALPGKSVRTGSRAMSSTCVTTLAACSIRRSWSPMIS
jgi:carboxyl-terminal processing protease